MATSASELPLVPVEPAAAELPLRTGPASDEIQGNILAGFLKDHQVFLFLQAPTATAGRAWLAALSPRIATTRQVSAFNAQFSNARRLRGGDDPENLTALWVNVAATHQGLLKLAPGREADLAQFTAFREGPAARAAALGDTSSSTPSRWLLGGPNRQVIDFIVTVAADLEDDLRLEMDRQRTLASTHRMLIVFEQRGDTLPTNRAGHEHFGFKDGISQPGIRGFDAFVLNKEGKEEKLGHPGTEMIAAGEFVRGHPKSTGTTDNQPAWMVNGSFQVFRRLAQDVPGWWAQVIRRANGLPDDDPMTPDLMGAKLVGRWRSGSPLALAPDRDNRPANLRHRDNAFTYKGDPRGIKTPHFAHIRKMYPRDDRFGDDQRRILRRGIPFGLPFDPAAGRGRGVDADRGLLFNVFMASIEDQFEFLQQTWANNVDFPEANDGPDPIIGDAPRPAPVRLRRDDLPDQSLDFRRFVSTTGAVYAFAPSLSTLRALSEGRL